MTTEDGSALREAADDAEGALDKANCILEGLEAALEAWRNGEEEDTTLPTVRPDVAHVLVSLSPAVIYLQRAENRLRAVIDAVYGKTGGDAR